MRTERYCKRTPDDPAPAVYNRKPFSVVAISERWTILVILGAVCRESGPHGSEGGDVPGGTDLSH